MQVDYANVRLLKIVDVSTEEHVTAKMTVQIIMDNLSCIYGRIHRSYYGEKVFHSGDTLIRECADDEWCYDEKGAEGLVEKLEIERLLNMCLGDVVEIAAPQREHSVDINYDDALPARRVPRMSYVEDMSGSISKEDVDAFLNGCYKVTHDKTYKECTCGAKHTSNPNYHMDWCDKE